MFRCRRTRRRPEDNDGSDPRDNPSSEATPHPSVAARAITTTKEPLDVSTDPTRQDDARVGPVQIPSGPKKTNRLGINDTVHAVTPCRTRAGRGQGRRR